MLQSVFLLSEFLPSITHNCVVSVRKSFLFL